MANEQETKLLCLETSYSINKEINASLDNELISNRHISNTKLKPD